MTSSQNRTGNATTHFVRRCWAVRRLKLFTTTQLHYDAKRINTSFIWCYVNKLIARLHPVSTISCTCLLRVSCLKFAIQVRYIRPRYHSYMVNEHVRGLYLTNCEIVPSHLCSDGRQVENSSFLIALHARRQHTGHVWYWVQFNSATVLAGDSSMHRFLEDWNIGPPSLYKGS